MKVPTNKEHSISDAENKRAPKINSLLIEYVQFLRHKKNLAANSVLAYQRDLQQYGLWLEDNDLECQDVDQRHVTQYLLYKMKSGAKANSSARTISALKGFYSYLQLFHHVLINPCSAIKAPPPIKTSQAVLTFTEVEQLLLSPDLTLLIGIRDRAMLELLYATGISISELVSLKCDDINFSKAKLTIKGKGAKNREIPLIENALNHVKSYMREARTQLLKDRDCEYLFVNKQAKSMTRQAFWYRIKYYVQAQGMKESVSAQQVRKAFAVHLLNKGVEVEQMQYLLGHTAQASTEAYNKLSKSN